MSTLRVAGRRDVFTGDSWQAALAVGAASIGLGVMIMVWPNKSVQVAGLLFALCLALTAAWQLIFAFRVPIARGLRVLEFLGALLGLVLAWWCMQSGNWVQLLALWVGLGWAIHGIVQALVAVWSNDLPGTGRQELYGMSAVLIGAILIVWPIDTLEALALFAGICLIMLGALEIRVAIRLERPETAAAQVSVRGLLRSH